MEDRQRRIIVSPSFGAQVAEGLLPGVTAIRKIGHNLAVPSTYETVWCNSSVYSYLTTADNVDIVSDSVEDKVDGTGARSIYINGLDADYNEQNETIVPTGTVAAVSTKKYIRIFTMKIILVGSGGINAGNITLADVTGSKTLAYLEEGEGRSLAALFTVPADKVGTITRWTFGEVNAKRSHIAMFVRPYGKSWFIMKVRIMKNQSSNGAFSIPIVLQAKTDIEIRAKSLGEGGMVAASFAGYYQ